MRRKPKGREEDPKKKERGRPGEGEGRGNTKRRGRERRTTGGGEGREGRTKRGGEEGTERVERWGGRQKQRGWETRRGRGEAGYFQLYVRTPFCILPHFCRLRACRQCQTSYRPSLRPHWGFSGVAHPWEQALCSESFLDMRRRLVMPSVSGCSWFEIFWFEPTHSGEIPRS